MSMILVILAVILILWIVSVLLRPRRPRGGLVRPAEHFGQFCQRRVRRE